MENAFVSKMLMENNVLYVNKDFTTFLNQILWAATHVSAILRLHLLKLLTQLYHFAIPLQANVNAPHLT